VLKSTVPVKVEIRFLGTEQADIAEHLPSVERVDGKTVQFVAKDIIEAYRILELLICAVLKLYPYSFYST